MPTYYQTRPSVPVTFVAPMVATLFGFGLIACESSTNSVSLASSPQDCMERIFEGMAPVSDPNPIRLSRAAVQAMAASYGFVYGQARAIEEASRQHPGLSRELDLARLRFEEWFSPSLQVIDSILLARTEEWVQQREEVYAQIDERTASYTFSFDEAVEVIETVNARTRGERDLVFVQPLLTYHPRFRQRPSEELTDGFRRVYSTAGSDMDSGVPLRLQVPVSWVGRDGERPNILQTFTSEGGRGLETFMVQVRELGVTNLNRAEVEEIAWDPGLANALMTGTTFTELCAARTRLDGLPAQAIFMKGTTDSPSMTIEQIAVAYVTVVDDRMVLLQGMVGDELGTGDALKHRFEIFAPAFGLMASSVVFESRW